MTTPFSKWLLRAYCVCAAVTLGIIWLNRYPAGIDLPQHANLFQILAGYSDQRSGYQFFYSRDFFTPYAITYLLGWALTSIGGALFATKALLSLAALGTPAMMMRWLRSIGADPSLGLFGFVVTFGFGYIWGFISFVLSAPIAFLYLAELNSLRTSRSWKRLAISSALGLLLFFTHGITFGFCMLAAGGICLFQRSPRHIAFELLHFLPLVACVVYWRSGQPRQDMSFAEGATLDRVLMLFSGAWTIQPSRSVAALVIAGTLLLMVGGRARPALTPARWLPLMLGVLGALLLPDKISNTSFVGSRFVQFVYWFGLGAFDFRAAGHALARLRWFSLSAVLILLGGLEYRLVIFNRECEGLEEVAALIPRGHDLKLHGGVTVSESFGPGALGQVAAWITAERGGFLENDFGRYFQVPVQRRPSQQWPEEFPYFVTRGTAAEARGFAGDGPQFVANRGHFDLFMNGPTVLHLTDLELIRFAQGWGPLRQNLSVEGHGLSVGGLPYAVGVGTHANSVLQLRPTAGSRRIMGAAGIDDAAPGDPTVIFSIVKGTREVLWKSAQFKRGQAATRFDLSLENLDGDLFLLAESPTGNIVGAHADWLDLQVTR